MYSAANPSSFIRLSPCSIATNRSYSSAVIYSPHSLPLPPCRRSSVARSWTSAATCTPSSAASSPPPSLPASTPRSDSRTLPAESPSAPPGSVAAAVCVKSRGNPYFCSTEDFLNCMSSFFSVGCKLAAIWSIAESVSTFLRPIILPCSIRTLSSGRSDSDRFSCSEKRAELKTWSFFMLRSNEATFARIDGAIEGFTARHTPSQEIL